MGKIRAFTPGGLQTMLSKIVQINVMAGGNTSSITTLGEDLAAFAELVTEELRGKRDNALCVSCVLPVAGWVRDGPSGYPYRLDVLAEGITGRDRAEVVLEPSSQDTARKCALCPSCETLDGRIRFWATSIPAADIAANGYAQVNVEVYWFCKCVQRDPKRAGCSEEDVWQHSADAHAA